MLTTNMEAGFSYPVGISILVIVFIAVAAILIFLGIPRPPGPSNLDIGVLFLILAIDAIVLYVLYKRTADNTDAIKELVNSSTASISVKQCPDYYVRSSSNTCMAPADMVAGDQVNLGDINNKSRAEQCAQTETRVWTHLSNLCG